MDADRLLSLITAAENGSADKAMDIADFGASLLNPEQFNRFIRIVQDKTIVLAESRRVTMTAPERVIDLIGLFEWVLRAGNDAAGEHRDFTNEPGSKARTRQNKLTARELVAKTGLFDKAERRNIERNGFENTLLDLLGGAAARDLSAYVMLANSSKYDPNASELELMLSQANGFLVRAAHQLYGVESAVGAADADFDVSAIGTSDYETAGAQARTLMTIMYESIEDKYIGGNERDYRYYCSRDFFHAYREHWIKRSGPNADAVLAEGRVPTFLGIPLVHATELSRDPAGDRHVMLSHPDNQNYGVLHEVTMEPDRIPGNRKTDFYLTFEGDMNYEDEFGSVTANLDTPKAA